MKKMTFPFYLMDQKYLEHLICILQGGQNLVCSILSSMEKYVHLIVEEAGKQILTEYKH